MTSINEVLSVMGWDEFLKKYNSCLQTSVLVQVGSIRSGSDSESGEKLLPLYEQEMRHRLQAAANIKTDEGSKAYPPLVNVSDKLREIWTNSGSKIKKEIANQILLFLCNEDAVVTEHQFGMVEETIDHAVAMFEQEKASVSEMEAVNIPIDAFVGMNIANYIIVANSAHKS